MTIHAERVWFYGPRPHLDDPNKCTFTKFSLMLPEDKIRDEKKFDSKELLIKQIEKDKEVCIELIDTFKEKYEI